MNLVGVQKLVSRFRLMNLNLDENPELLFLRV